MSKAQSYNLTGQWCDDGGCMQVTQTGTSVRYVQDIRGWHIEGSGSFSNGNVVKLIAVQENKAKGCKSSYATTWTMKSNTLINFSFEVLENDACGNKKGRVINGQYWRNVK